MIDTVGLPAPHEPLALRHLILVKHSLPQIEPAVPAREWQLSDEGRNRCAALAQQLAAYRPASIVSSHEPKAAETAALLAAGLHTRARSADDLHEHDRYAAGWLGTPARFNAAVEAFFAHPSELRFGSETADQAHARFAAAVAREVAAADGNVIIVAHGTVIALFVARCTGAAPFPLWQRLGLPSYVVLALPAHNLVAVGEAISAAN